MFENIKKNLQKINSDLFMTTNNIEKSTEIINDRLQNIDKLIAQEKINKLLGMNLSEKMMIDILKRLSFKIKKAKNSTLKMARSFFI